MMVLGPRPPPRPPPPAARPPPPRPPATRPWRLAGEADTDQLGHCPVAPSQPIRSPRRSWVPSAGSASPVLVLAQPDRSQPRRISAPSSVAPLVSRRSVTVWDAEDGRMGGVRPVRPRLVDAGEGTTERGLGRGRGTGPAGRAVHHLEAGHVPAERPDPWSARPLHHHDHGTPGSRNSPPASPRPVPAGNDHLHQAPLIQPGCRSASRPAQPGGKERVTPCLFRPL